MILTRIYRHADGGYAWCLRVGGRDFIPVPVNQAGWGSFEQCFESIRHFAALAAVDEDLVLFVPNDDEPPDVIA